MKNISALKLSCLLFFLAILLSGCGNTRVSRLQNRVDVLEERMDMVEVRHSETASVKEDSSYPAEIIIAEAPPAPRRCPDSLTKKDIQRALRKAGYYTGSIDGIFGLLTERAVKDFQRDHGLQVDGVVGPITRRALVENISW